MLLSPENIRQFDNLLGVGEVLPNTTKLCKEEGMVIFAEHLANRPIIKGDGDVFSQLYKEPSFDSLFGSAYHKALSMKLASPEHAVGSGSDGTFWIFDGEKNSWVQMHQLGRTTKVPSEDTIIREYRYLKSLVVHPKTSNNRVYLAWGHGLSYVNGGVQNYGDLLLGKAAPMDPEYFREVFAQSVLDGSFLKINARIPAFQAFAKGELFERIGFIPDKAVYQKQSVLPYMAESNEKLCAIGMLEVMTTMPWSLLGFDEAQQFAQEMNY